MLGFKAPIEPLRRFEHYFRIPKSQSSRFPYLKTPTPCLPPRKERATPVVSHFGRAEGYNFAVDHDYFENVSGRHWRIAFRSSRRRNVQEHAAGSL